MREGVMLLAKANLCSVIENTIAKAQSFVEAPNALTDELTSEEILQKQVVELKGVAPKFISLLKIMREDKVSFVFSNLRTILNKIGFSLLSHVDNLLDNQKPYSPQNLTFTYWDGEIGASYKAYSASDDDELKMYLTLQKKTISRIAIEFAEPIVQLLKSDVVFDQNFGNHGQLTKWIRIVDGVKAFQTRDPTNPISTMERFIIKTLNSYNLDNITTEIPQHSIKGESNEYFSNLIKQIKRNIMAKAEILLRQRNIKRYNALLDFYNKHLANKYPFANYDNTKRSSVDADLDTVKQFFVMYDEFGGSPEKILDQIYQLGPEADDMFKFLQKVHVLRQFLGGSIMSTGDIPKIKLSIDFGINKKNEINTGYLVDRIFKPNHDSSIEFISEDKSGLWYFGESVQIVFRWAEGDENAEKPSLDSDDPDKLIDNTKAIVECVGDWSILRFLQKYKAKDASVDKLSNNQNLLCFEIPLTNNKKSKVYVAITAALPSIPGETSVTTLAIPSPIGDIPKMSQQVVAVSNTPVLVDRISSGNADISIEPVESISEEEESTTASSQEKKHITQTTGKKKATTKSAQTTTKSGSKPKNEKEKAMEILESSNSTSSNNEEEKVAEITEEIIE
jgi:hypothetical protein